MLHSVSADEDKRASLYRPREPRISPWIVWSGPSNGRSGWSQRDSPGSGRSNESATPEPVQKRHIPVRLLFAMAEIDLRRVAVKMQVLDSNVSELVHARPDQEKSLDHETVLVVRLVGAADLGARQ